MFDDQTMGARELHWGHKNCCGPIFRFRDKSNRAISGFRHSRREIAANQWFVMEDAIAKILNAIGYF